MKLSNEGFIQLIATNSGLDLEDCQSYFNVLIEEIKNNLKDNGTYQLKGFGVFSVDEAGLITFKEDEILSIELNFEYAGLKPIEIAPPLTPNKAEEEVASEEEVESEVEEQPEESLEEEEKGLDEEVFMHPDLRVAEEEYEHMQTDEEGESFLKEEDEEMSALFGADDDYSEMEKPASDDNKAFDKFRTEQKKERSKNLRAVVFTVLFAVIIGVVLWIFVLKPYLDSSARLEEEVITQETQSEIIDESDSTAVSIVAVNEESPEKVLDEAENTSSIEENESQAEAIEQEIAPVNTVDDSEIDTKTSASDDIEVKSALNQSTSSSNLFGLKGGKVSAIENSTTIVLHALNTRESAEGVASDLKKDGYRTVIYKATLPDGRSFWRVGIGQFPNFAEAASIRSSLPEPYNSRSFVAKIIF